MAIETRRARKIVLRAVTPKHYEKKAAGAFKPGHLVIETSDGEVLAQNVAGAHASFVAKEDTFQGKTIDDAYADGDVAMLHAIQPGDGLQLRVAIGAPAIVKGDPLVAAADGTVLKGAPTALLQYSSIAESAEHENTTDAADFDKSYTIPANTLRVGDVIRVKAQVTVVDNNSTDTLTLLLNLGSNLVVTTAAVDVADGDVGYIEADIVIRAIGATGGFQATGVQGLGVPGTVTAKPFLKNDATVDTTAALKVAINADWSVAHADNEASLSLLTVELLRVGQNGAVAFAEEDLDNSAGSEEEFIYTRAA